MQNFDFYKEKKMKRFLIALVLIALTATVASAQSMSTVGPGTPLNSMSSFPACGKMVALATPTLTMDGISAKIMGTVPAGTVAVIAATNPVGAVHFGSSGVKSQADGFWPQIGTQSYVILPIYPGTVKPEIYFAPVATGAAVIVRLIAIVQK